MRILAFLAFLFGAAPAFAASTEVTTGVPAIPLIPLNAAITFSSSYTPSTVTTLVTPPSNGAKVTVVNLATSNSAALIVSLWKVRNSVNTLICTVSLPAYSGYYNGSTVYAPVNLISPQNCPGLVPDSNGNPFILLQGSNDSAGFADLLAVSSSTAPASSLNLYIMAQGGSFSAN